MDRIALYMAMCNGETVTIDNATGKIIGIEPEDGSGYNFNVTMAISLKVSAQYSKPTSIKKFYACPRPVTR